MALFSYLPPGPAHLLVILPPRLFPPIATYAALTFWLPGLVPSWAIPPLSLLALPLAALLASQYHRYRVRLAAASHGAILPSESKDPSFLGIETMKRLKHRYINGHISLVYRPWVEEHGRTVMLNIFGERRVFTMEPEHVKCILAGCFDDFEKGPIFISQMQTLLGTGVFNADGDIWRFHRNATKKFFTKDRVSDFDNFDRHCDKAIALAQERFSKGLSLDFQDLAGRFTLDSASEFLFGNDLNSLSAGLAYSPKLGLPNPDTFISHPSNHFIRAFAQGQDQSALRSRTGHNWPLFEFWGDQVLEKRRIVDQYIQGLVEDDVQHKVDEDGEFTTLLAFLKESLDDPTIIQDEIVNLMVAGRDTTASVLSFAIYRLAMHPEIAQKLSQEVMLVVGPARTPTFDDLKKMKYLRAFLNEVLRMYPPVPLNQRTTNKDTVLLSKDPSMPRYFVPARTRVHYSIIAIQRGEEFWGSTASQFDPDRFIDDRLSKYLNNPYIFVPFNAGPRICIGQQFAYNEASYFLIKWMQAFGNDGKYNIKLATEDQPDGTVPPDTPQWLGEKVWPIVGLTLSVKGGLWVKQGAM